MNRRKSSGSKSSATPFVSSSSDSYSTTSFSPTKHSSSSNSSMSGSSNGVVAEFDALRREATKLERHLEDKVARYQQLAQRLMTGDSLSNNRSSSSQSSSLLDSAETGTVNGRSSSSFQKNGHGSGGGGNNDKDNDEESSLSSDISRTISAMSDLVNDRMSPAADKTGRSQHALLVKRYREILFDCSADFQKTSAAVQRRREATELFRKRDGSRAGGNNNNDQNSEMEQLLRERNAVGNSVRATHDVIGQAEEIRSDLRQQGSSLRGVSGTMATIAGTVPGLNHLIEGIRRKRSRDDMIVSGAIASCILFTLWYVFS